MILFFYRRTQEGKGSQRQVMYHWCNCSVHCLMIIARNAFFKQLTKLVGVGSQFFGRELEVRVFGVVVGAAIENEDNFNPQENKQRTVFVCY